jgi:uncharacterized secreted protein with C-terminal beta-propeller domain
MSDDDFDRRLRAARPHTPADDAWAASADGDATLESIRRAVKSRPRRRRRFALASISHLPGRPAALGIGLTAAAALAATLAVTVPGHSPSHSAIALSPPPSGHHNLVAGPRPADMALVAYQSCDAALSGLRAQAQAHVSAYEVGYPYRYGYQAMKGGALDSLAPVAAGSGAAAPAHSTTNNQETGVDEPDLVQTDGNRVVSISGSVLRVTDVATHDVTGSLDLSMYAGADAAQLLLSGDHVLVVLGGSTAYVRGGPMIDSVVPYGGGTTASSGYLLVDVATKQPTVVSSLHTKGGYVDARMVDGTVRLVVQSAPKIAFPIITGNVSTKQRLARARAAVAATPLSAWLPSYDVTTNGVTTTHAVPCEQVSHPSSYTGASMLTIYTLDVTGESFDNLAPVSLAADGTTVYASASSLYVASGTEKKTQLHRFDIVGSGPPTYLGSGSVPGGLLDAYSLSDYDGSLRAVTTKNAYGNTAMTSVYVLDAATLTIRGHVGGLGRNEQVHAVRFLGPLAYVVTFQSVDPLYVLDLHDPANPRKVAALTLTGYSDYLHPTSDGRLLGVGENVNANQMVTGLQVSLFDVSNPAHPTRLDRLVRKHTPGENTLDPHAFLYWPATGTAVVPIQSWNSDESGAVLVLHVGTHHLRTVGLIRNPAVSTDVSGYDQGIERTMVIGDSIWTMSTSGLAVSSATDLTRQAWIPFS